MVLIYCYHLRIFGAEKFYNSLLDGITCIHLYHSKNIDKKLFIILNCSSYMRTLKLLNLHCNKIDDNNTKIDETFLTVDNGNFQGFGPESMKNGSDWNINANIQFNVEAIVSFYDEDLIGKLSNTKYFSSHIVEENEVLKGPKTVSFASNNANYVLTYEIV
jgi:hypothetical protein